MRIQTLTFLLYLFFILYNEVLAQPQQPCLKVKGEVKKSIALYSKDIASMKRTSVRFKEFSGLEYFYSGVSIQEILKQAGVSVGSKFRRKNLVRYVLVISADGSEVVFSAAELDSTFSDKTIILSDKINDKPLPEGLGPFRLVVPGEENRIRWLWEVNALIVGFARE